MTYSGNNDNELSLWHEEEGLYFDAIQWGPGATQQLPIRSLVGLIPLYATLTLEPSVIDRLPGFKKRMQWFIDNRPEIAQRNMASLKGSYIVCSSESGAFFSYPNRDCFIARGKGERKLLALASKERLVRILEKMLDETEFLSDHGIRS